jgi:hypothetical protein
VPRELRSHGRFGRPALVHDTGAILSKKRGFVKNFLEGAEVTEMSHKMGHRWSVKRYKSRFEDFHQHFTDGGLVFNDDNAFH